MLATRALRRGTPGCLSSLRQQPSSRRTPIYIVYTQPENVSCALQRAQGSLRQITRCASTGSTDTASSVGSNQQHQQQQQHDGATASAFEGPPASEATRGSTEPLEALKPPAMTEDPMAELDANIVEHLHEGILWFSNLFPVQHGRWDLRHIIYKKRDVNKTLDRLIDKMHSKHAINIRQVIPKPEEGGAFVAFASTAFDAKETANIITSHLKRRRPKSLLVKEPIRASLVTGKPFIHDMVAFPSKRVHITFRGEPLPLEELYSVLRPYGQLLALHYTTSDTPAPASFTTTASSSSTASGGKATSATWGGGADSGVMAVAVYNKIHGAIGARNCVHGTLVHGTRLNIHYAETIKTSAVWEFVSRNSRLLTPLLLSLLLVAVYHMFDPIRVFNVENRITGRFSFRRRPHIASDAEGAASAEGAGGGAAGGTETGARDNGFGGGQGEGHSRGTGGSDGGGYDHEGAGARWGDDGYQDSESHTREGEGAHASHVQWRRKQHKQQKSGEGEEASEDEEEVERVPSAGRFGPHEHEHRQGAEPTVSKSAGGFNVFHLVEDTVSSAMTSAMSSLSSLADMVNSVLLRKYEAIPPAWSKAAEAKLIDATSRDTAAFILLAGPTGCGKTTMMKRVRHSFPHHLEISFRDTDTFSTDERLLEHLKASVGYSPALTFIHAIRTMYEQVIAMSSRGVVSPQTSVQSHTNQVLECVTQALLHIKRSRGDKGAARPLIVLNGFDTVFVRDHEEFAHQLLHWARAISAAQLATVVVLCDVNIAQEVEDSPETTAGDRPETVLLEDADKEHSIALLRGELDNVAASPAAFATTADVLGGRLSDLRTLVLRIKTTAATSDGTRARTLIPPQDTLSSVSGSMPLSSSSASPSASSTAKGGGDTPSSRAYSSKASSALSQSASSSTAAENMGVVGDEEVYEALEFVVAGAVAFLRSTALGLGSSKELPWTRAQAWYVLRLLHESPDNTVSYDELLFSAIFDGNEAPLRAMQRAEIITVRRDRFGRQQACFARPVLKEATTRLLQDKHLLSGLQRTMLKQLRDMHYDELQRLEAELSRLQGIDAAKASVSIRRSTLARQMEYHAREIDAIDRQMEDVAVRRS